MPDLVLMVAAAGWLLAAFFSALWWGERQRRMDAQQREGRIPVRARQQKANVTGPGGTALAPLAPEAEHLNEAKEAYIADAMNNGLSRKLAEQDWEQVSAAATMGGGGVEGTSW